MVRIFFIITLYFFQITMDDFRRAHNTATENTNGNDIVPMNGFPKEGTISAVHRIWGGDKRIALFGYTLETINLLLLPMIETKLVGIRKIYLNSFRLKNPKNNLKFCPYRFELYFVSAEFYSN